MTLPAETPAIDLEALDPSSGAHLLASAVTAGYGGAPVLKAVSIEVKKREVVVVLGRNGAGKTTLLNAISGLVPVVAGSIELEGVDITRWPAFKRVSHGIAHVPQGRRIIPGLSVLENLQVGSYPLRTGRDRVTRLAEVLSMFPNLRSWLHKDGRSLSGGEQQLLALGR